MKEPLVSAIMVTGKSEEHEKLARIAVRSFLEQSYQDRELVIVNGGLYEMKIGHPQVREVWSGPESSLEELRNLGLSQAKGAYIIQWDDDDYHHPHRILYQMAHRQGDSAVVLRKQVRVNISKGVAICVEQPTGIPGTILHPANSNKKYQHANNNFQSREFLKSFGGNVIAVDNGSDVWPGPALYLRFYHGRNSHTEEELMGGLGTFTDQWVPNQDEKDYISHLLRTHYGVEIGW